jgi:hypothetical protein
LKTNRPLQSPEATEQRECNSAHLRLVDGAGEMPERALEQPTCSTVACESPDWVEKSIVAMLEEWRARRDERALRSAIGRLIAAL